MNPLNPFDIPAEDVIHTDYVFIIVISFGYDRRKGKRGELTSHSLNAGCPALAGSF
jgi:hypothetical protein